MTCLDSTGPIIVDNIVVLPSHSLSVGRACLLPCVQVFDICNLSCHVEVRS